MHDPKVKDLTLVILAAGMGSRYGGLKQMDPVGPHGATIMDYSVYDALRAGFNKVVFVIRPDIEDDFKKQIGSRYADKVAVDYVFQRLEDIPEGAKVLNNRGKPWGTGQANLTADGAVNEPFAAINADDFYGSEAFKTLADYLLQDSEGDALRCAMVGYTLRSTLSEFGSVGRGVCQCDDAGYLKTIVEMQKIEKNGNAALSFEKDGTTRDLTGDEIVSMNFWGFTPGIFEKLRSEFARFLEKYGCVEGSEFHLPAAINTLIRKGELKVKVLASSGKWVGVTYREDKPYVEAAVQKLVADGIYPEKLWAS